MHTLSNKVSGHFYFCLVQLYNQDAPPTASTPHCDKRPVPFLKVTRLLSANHRARKPLLIPQFLFAACMSPVVTMTTDMGAVVSLYILDYLEVHV